MNTQGKHQFEMGFGAYFRGDFTDKFTMDMPGLLFPIMYRYQEGDQFYVRLGFNFVAGNYVEIKPIFSLGYRF